MIVHGPIRCSRELKSVSLRSSQGELGAAIGGGSKCSLVIIPAGHAAPRQIIFECARSVYRGAALHSKADVPLNLFDVGYGRQRNRRDSASSAQNAVRSSARRRVAPLASGARTSASSVSGIAGNPFLAVSAR